MREDVISGQDSSSDESLEHSLLDEIADEFVTRIQSGEAATMEEYCERFPALTSEIKELFPVLAMLDEAKSDIVDTDECLPPPDAIGEYLVQREIGRGGMGVIYEARHIVVGRRVALKVLSQRLSSDAKAKIRFEREARAIAGMHHTNIVPLFEFGSDGEHHFLVMQLIEGQSVDKLLAVLRNDRSASDSTLTDVNLRLADLLKSDSKDFDLADDVPVQEASGSGKLFPASRIAEIANLGFQIASALEHAHQRGIIHRDVKPSNILLDERGVAWLTDFGLAKTEEEELTQTGDFLGTLRYTAPERFRGQCDGRSDQYALGLTLYELLCLRPAFTSEDRLQLVHEIERGTPVPLAKQDAKIPKDLQTIVEKAIDHDPARRYRSAGAMATDLQRFLVDEPIKARKMSALEKLQRWRRKNLALANAVALVVLLLAITTVGAIGASVREAGLRREAESAREIAGERGQELQRTLYAAEMNLAGDAAAGVGAG